MSRSLYRYLTVSGVDYKQNMEVIKCVFLLAYEPDCFDFLTKTTF